MLFLYHAPMSPCVQKVRLTLAEKGIEWQGQLFNLQSKEQLNPEYLKINPAGLVPALVDGSHVVTESTVICEYLEDKFPSRVSLRPERAIDRARMRHWLKRVDDLMHPNTGALVFGAFVRNAFLSKSRDELDVMLAKVPDPVRRERQRRLIELGLDAPDIEASLAAYKKGVAAAEEALGQNKWLAGDKLSLADLALTPYIFVCDYLNMACVFDQYPALTAWYRRMKLRASFSEAITEWTVPDEMAQIKAVGPTVGPQFCERWSKAA